MSSVHRVSCMYVVAFWLFSSAIIDSTAISISTDLSHMFNFGGNLGVINGGDLSVLSGRSVHVTGGVGYLFTGTYPNEVLKNIVWSAQNITLPANADNFIYVDSLATVQSSMITPTAEHVIFLGKARTTATDILFIQEFPDDARNTGQRITKSIEDSVGTLYISGSLTATAASGVEIAVSSGRYVFGTHEYAPSGANPIHFSTWSRDGLGDYQISATSTTQIDVSHWDDGSGTLAAIPNGSYARQVLFIAGDGVNETYLFQYGQTLYTSDISAQIDTLPTPPPSWSGNIAGLASLVVNGAAVVAITDERPFPFVRSTSFSEVTVHGQLAGLSADDHHQYLLVNGSRAMTGDLNMGAQSITNVNLVDGVDVSAHGSRHNPSGADPISTAAPVTISTANVIGSANALARADHVHAHGDQPGGTLHAIATNVSAGFMSAPDKTTFDTLVSTTSQFVLKAGSTMIGNLTHAGGTGDIYAGSTSGTVTITAPATVTSYSVTLPNAQGAASSVLTNNGSGALSWASPALSSNRMAAYRSSNLAVTANNFTVVFDTATISNAAYNTTTGVYTAPATGFYLIMSNVTIVGAVAGTFTINFGVAGSPLAGFGQAIGTTIGGTSSVTLIGIVSLTANDTFSILASRTGLGNPTIQANLASLSIQHIG